MAEGCVVHQADSVWSIHGKDSHMSYDAGEYIE